MSYKVGIIGYGVMGKTRHLAIDEIKRGKVVAISEPNIGSDFEGIPNLSHDEIINHSDLDVIIVCTPNFLNKDLTIKSLNAGKHVFCEKPPAFTGADIEDIINAEKSSGKTLMYGFNHRHHDSVMHMKRLIDSNEYGKVLWLRGRYGKSVTKDYFDQWRAKKELAGGGILMDQGIHMLDLFLYLSGDFDVVKAEVSNLYWNMDVEDNAFVILKESATGKVASLHSTMSQWRHLFSLEIFLEKGYMVLNGLITSTMSYGEETLSIAKNRSTAPAATWKDEVVTKYVNNNSWRYEMDHFFDAIDNKQPVTIGSSDDALKLMRIIDKVYEQKDF
ncbi:Gfo/Idh/MocA family oxidoreductase [Mucilaginibacter sp.]|uniref:Gfo/Idh/MocA family protein n=1 Tax=Mucilaginibacter sp. TaxID=1882438 RepID=UPI0028511A30|nr:Gfo/Idh/MocA family oxidoreductase [Mucilaginibacter sp.]MDR3696322.1 Gfo/Idh/MocA family oxidoreductase [Mucilaginibacter sp.]